MVTYSGISGASSLAQLPARSVLRVSFVRANDALDVLTFGREPWRDIVQGVIDAGASPYAFPITANAGVGNDSRAATIDYRLATRPSGTVADFLEMVRSASRYARPVSVEMIGTVPGNSDGGAIAVEQGRTQQQERTQQSDAALSPVSRVARAGAAAATSTAMALRALLWVAGIAAVAYLITSASPLIGRAKNWE